jgi:hypothetical protein
MTWIIPEDVCNGTPGAAMDWSELLFILGPIGAVILLLVCGERAVAWRRRRKSRTRWVPPITAPTKREVKDLAAAVEDIETKAAEAGPHVETTPVTDDEIDEWARGE